MKFPHYSNPALITSDDETRYTLHFVKIEDGYAIATNGKQMLIQGIRHDRDDARRDLLIHRNPVLKAVKRAKKFVEEDASISIGETSVTISGKFGDSNIASNLEFVDEPGSFNFPNWSQVIPRETERVRVGINAKMLLELSRAMQGKRSSHVYLDIDPSDTTGVMIVTCDHRDCFGILSMLKYVPELTGQEAWEFAQERRRETELPKGWKPMRTAPKGGMHIRCMVADGTIHDDVHWASNLTGEEQPGFQGWFIPIKNGFQQILPTAWQDISAA
jgi:hypothetical protein